MREMNIKNITNDSNDVNDTNEEELMIEDSNEQINNEEEEKYLGKVLIEGKVNNFKLRLIKQFIYLEEHYIISAFIKLIFGIVILILPFLCIIIFNSIDFSDKNKYIFFPYFISLSIILGALTILLVIKIGEGCQMYGIIIYTWERKNIFKIINSIIIGLFLLWIFFVFESFSKSYNILREKVGQTTNKEFSTKLFNKGSYTLRILFILFFWDTDKDQNGKYLHEVLEYFEYEESVLTDFNSYIQYINIPILLLSIYILFKIIFFKDRKKFILLLLNILIAFQSLYLIVYPIKNKDNSGEYFSNSNCKYVELIVYVSIIVLLIFGSFKEYIIKFNRRNYFTKKENDKNYIIVIVIIIGSFVINIIGYIFAIVLLFLFVFDKINEHLKIQRYYLYWVFIYLIISFILFGYSFIFGHYCYNLIFYPISYEILPHAIKNQFYTKCSEKPIESVDNSKYKFSRKSFDVYIN